MALPPHSEPMPPEDLDIASVGEELSLAAVHLRGLHLVAHPDCWRCRRAGRELTPVAENAEPSS